LLASGIALAASAQVTNAPAPASATATATAKNNQAFQAQNSGGFKASDFVLQPPKPNEIVIGKVTYSGIAIAASKTGKPLQLLNPLAPSEYGLPEDNVVRDPITRNVSGLKIFSIRF
jgi:hypothetical protein